MVAFPIPGQAIAGLVPRIRDRDLQAHHPRPRHRARPAPEPPCLGARLCTPVPWQAAERQYAGGFGDGDKRVGRKPKKSYKRLKELEIIFRDGGVISPGFAAKAHAPSTTLRVVPSSALQERIGGAAGAPWSSPVCGGGGPHGVWWRGRLHRRRRRARSSYASCRKVCFCWPRPSMPSSTTSPSLRKTGGFMPRPTPGGVPVEMMSPGWRLMNWER